MSLQHEGSHVLIATKSIVRKLITTYHRDSAVITRLSPTQTISAAEYRRDKRRSALSLRNAIFRAREII